MDASWRHAIAFLVGGAVVLAAAYTVSETVDPVYPQLKARIARFHERPDTVEVVTVGNSHTRAIDLPTLGVRGMHFWEGGQDVFEAAHLARQLGREGTGLRYVLLTASYGLQRVDHAVVTSSDLTSRRRVVYARTPLARPLPGDWKLWGTGVLTPLARPDHWEGVAAALARSLVPRKPGAGDRPRPPRITPSPDSLRRYAATVGTLHRRLGSEVFAAAPSTPSRVAELLIALARDLDAVGITLVLYTPPYHESYLRTRDPTVTAEMHAVLARVARSSDNVVWLDFSEHPDFIRRPEFFRNSDHVSPEGGRVFSAELRRCLDALGRGAPFPKAAVRRCPGLATWVASEERVPTGRAIGPETASGAPTNSPAERREGE